MRICTGVLVEKSWDIILSQTQARCSADIAIIYITTSARIGGRVTWLEIRSRGCAYLSVTSLSVGNRGKQGEVDQNAVN